MEVNKCKSLTRKYCYTHKLDDRMGLWFESEP